MKMWIAAAGMAVLASPAAAADWRVSTASHDVVQFIDVDSIRRDGESAVVRAWLVMGEPKLGGDNMKFAMQVACSTGRSRRLELDFYRGTERVTRLAEPGAMGGDMSGTIALTLANQACGKAQPDHRTIADPLSVGRDLLVRIRRAQ